MIVDSTGKEVEAHWFVPGRVEEWIATKARPYAADRNSAEAVHDHACNEKCESTCRIVLPDGSTEPVFFGLGEFVCGA